MDIDDDGVTDPTAEFGELFEGQTVAFENELVGHDADDMLGTITHDLGITSGPHHRSSHHSSDHDIMNFVPDDYLQGQQMVMDHDNQEYLPLQDVSGMDDQGQHQNTNVHNHVQNDGSLGTGDANQTQIYMHSNSTQQEHHQVQMHVNSDGVQGAQMMYEYNHNQIQGDEDQSAMEPPVPPEPVPEEPKVKKKVKVVKDVEYFTNENMDRYLKRRGFKSKYSSDISTKTISKAVFALSADSQICSENFRLVSFGSKYEVEQVGPEMERFWKFYLSTKSKNLAMSMEFLPMLIPMLLHFFFELALAHLIPIARRICFDFVKKFLHEDKTTLHCEILVAVMKISSVEMLKSDNILSPLINKKFEFTLTEQSLCLLRQFLSKSTQPILAHLFTNRFKISARESKELIESFDWEKELDSSEDSSESSDSEEEEIDEEEDEDKSFQFRYHHRDTYERRKYVRKVIEDVRNSTTANVPDISVYTMGDNPVCGAISKKGSLIAYGLEEAGIRLCAAENARDVTRTDFPVTRPSDPDTFYGVKTIAGHAGTVYGVHFHPRTKLLFSVGQDSLMRAWDLNAEDPKCRVVYRGHSGPIWKLDIPESGALVATAGLDGTARIFIPEKTEFVRIMVGHYCSVNSVKFHPNEAYIATGSADKSVRLWSVHDGNIVRMFTGSEASINCLAYHDSGKYLAGAGEDAKIIIWDLAQGEVLATLDSLPNCKDLQFQGNMLAACFRNGMLQMFNLRKLLGVYESCVDEGNLDNAQLPSICDPFTTQCYAKALFKLHYMDLGKLLCLGSDLDMDADELKAREAAKVNVEAEIHESNISQQETGSETLLQQVLQTNNPAAAAAVASGKAEKQSAKPTTSGTGGTSKILAARLSQPLPSISTSISGECSSDSGNESKSAMNESSLGASASGTVASGSTPANATQQMITSAELDAAIASVIDQSGCESTESGGAGTITIKSPSMSSSLTSARTSTACSQHTPSPSSRINTLNAYLYKNGYRMGKMIGEGSYSKVKLCPRRSDNGDGDQSDPMVACKVISKRKASSDFVNKFLPRELQIVSRIKHLNIVRVYDVVEFDSHVYIFMDYCNNGDLLEYVKDRGYIKESRGQHYFRQILSAVKYLHGLDIAHRDLKCENVLLTTDDQVRLSDFGFSRYCRDAKGKRILSSTYCGSCAYAAPEILQGTAYNPKLYDMWSLGCILFIMLTGHMPFDESNVPKMLQNQMEKNLNYPHQLDGLISKSAKRFIRHLLEPDVTRRATIEQANSNSWLTVRPHSAKPKAAIDNN